MKKVMLYAYTQFNLGDDLFIKILCERYPETTFVLYAPWQYRKTFPQLHNIQFCSNDSILSRGLAYFCRKLRLPDPIRKFLAGKCDAAVHIGGSLFIQGKHWEDELKNVKAMRIKQKPFFLLGANFGPYRDEEFYHAYKQLFAGYTDICFREKYSYELFQDLKQVRQADDIVFQLKKPMTKKPTNTVVISVIKPSIRAHLTGYDDIYYDKIRDIAVYFIEKGYRITFMSFCSYEKDVEAIEQILTRMPEKFTEQITIHEYKTNLDETLAKIAECEFMIASRFHAMILGWVYGKPVFPIIYSDKMKHVMDDVGFSGLAVYFEELHNVTPADVFQSMKTEPLSISRHATDAERHFEKLDKFLLG